MPRVFICHPIPDIGIRMLTNKGFKVQSAKDANELTEADLSKALSEYDAVITLITNKISDKIISCASGKLKVIANYAVGYDNIDVAAANLRGIAVCNTPGVASESVAEHTFSLILALNKMLFEQDEYTRRGKYKKWDPDLYLSHQVWGQTIGIIGLGRIGTFVGQIAYGGFRMKILYFDVKRAEDFELIYEAQYKSVDEILKEADIVSLHVPLSEKTKHLISKNQFKLMKKSAYLINTARGPIIDEKALVWALKEKLIAGTGLDVYENEPDFSKELTKMTNVILTPHTASATFETRDQMARISAQNVIDVFEGKEPQGLVKLRHE